MIAADDVMIFYTLYYIIPIVLHYRYTGTHGIKKRDFVVAPSSGGGNSALLHDSQGVDELATLDRYHHFHGHSGLCA